MSDTLHHLRQLEAAATPAPWRVGYWVRAGVMPNLYGDGKCAYCKTSGEPQWTGTDDINGKRRAAHHHLAPSDGHDIAGPDGHEVAGNYDYDAGGILNPADAALIAAARNALPHLLDIAEAADRLDIHCRDDGTSNTITVRATDMRRLRDALQRLHNTTP